MARLPQALGTPLVRRILSLDGLPDGVRQAANGEAGPFELERTAAISRELLEAGRSSADPGELSWGVLGSLLREELFLAGCRTGNFLRNRLAVPLGDVEQALRGILPLAEGHPYRNFVASYAMDARRRPKEYAALLKDIPLADLTYMAQPLLRA